MEAMKHVSLPVFLRTPRTARVLRSRSCLTPMRYHNRWNRGVHRSLKPSEPPWPPLLSIKSRQEPKKTRRGFRGGKEGEATAVIPESVLKKRKRKEELALAKKKVLEAKNKKDRENRKLIFTRAQLYAKEYESQEKELIRLKREVSPGAKILFIIRIRCINAMQPKNPKDFAALET